MKNPTKMLHRLVNIGRMNEQDFQRAGVRENDWYLARLVGGAIVLAGLLVIVAVVVR